MKIILGDMDFKVAGTESGITALQMDIKITSITHEIMKIALEQAHQGRLYILEQMSKSLTESRQEVSSFAPHYGNHENQSGQNKRYHWTHGGKVIREICEKANVKIDIDEDGSISISGQNPASIDDAMNIINSIVGEPEVGTIYTGKVVKIMEFGAFVNFMGSKDGLVHISELSPMRVNKVTDVVQVGDIVQVKFVGLMIVEN